MPFVTKKRNMGKCEICFLDVHKYKCPKCFLKYCSVPCFKRHKDEQCPAKEIVKLTKAIHPSTAHPSIEEPSDFSPVNEEHFDTEDRIQSQVLKTLEGCEEFVDKLRDPRLQEKILDLNSAVDPQTAISAAMQDPLFVEFADQCLALVEPAAETTRGVHLDPSDSDSDWD